MTAQQAEEYLTGLPVFGSRPGLARMRSLMARLGNVQDAVRTVHVAGTNGKGSVCAFTAAILQQQGYSVGLFTSPHLIDYRERFCLNGLPAPKRAFASAVAKVQAAIAAMQADGEEPPVRSEAEAATAFVLFHASGCDFAVIETSLGGRCDASNVLKAPMVVAITRIGLDHTNLLGSTLAAIAAEKAAIIKKGCEVVCCPAQPKEALGEILAQAATCNANVTVPDPEDITVTGKGLQKTVNYGGYEVKLKMPGAVQAQNMAMAVEIALALWRQGVEISDESILDGLAAACLPGRQQVLSEAPLLVADVCHNPDAFAALAATLTEAKVHDAVVVAAISCDKDADSCLKALKDCASVVYTAQAAIPKAIPADTLAETAKKYFQQVISTTDPLAAVRQERAAGKAVVVCGSFYLVGPLLTKLKALV